MRPVEVELPHTDGQTDMPKLIVAFRNFANAPKNYKTELSYYNKTITQKYLFTKWTRETRYTSIAAS